MQQILKKRSLKGFHEDREVVQEASPSPRPWRDCVGRARVEIRAVQFFEGALNLDITDSS